MNKDSIYFIILLFWVTYSLNAQNSQLRSYSIEDGLPQSQVFDIVQDNTGYLWLGTQGGGLSSFNGANFSIWNENHGLLSNYIHTLHTSNDSLYIGTDRGLSIKVKNNFTNFKSPVIHDFFVSKGQLYLGTKAGIYSYSKTKGLNKIKLRPEIDNNIINEILFDGKFYWIATGEGLWKTLSLKIPKQLKKVAINNYKAIVYNANTIFAATFNNGVLILDTKDSKGDLFLPKPNRINTMSIHNKNELWIATDNEGIIVLDTENYSQKRRIGKTKGLAVSHIRKVFTDRQSNIWIATSGGGLYKYFQNNFQHFDATSGLKGNRIYAVHNAEDGIWISSSEAGLTKIDSLGIHHLPKINNFTDVKIKTITSGVNGNIWAGSEGRGILLRATKQIDSIAFDATDSLNIITKNIPKTVIKNHVLNTNNGFPSNWIRKLIKGENTIWAATYSSGIVQFNYDTDKDSLIIRKVYGKKEGITDLLIKDIALDAQDRLWYATQTGRLGYLKNGRNISIGSILKQQTAIRTLLFYQNKLFVGTAGKGIWVSKLDIDLPSFKPLKGKKEVSSKNIYQLIIDNEGYLWAGTERGVDKIQLNQDDLIEDIYHFGRNDGFLGIETCLNAVAKDDKGSIWFGALYGLTKYTPNTDFQITLKPQIHFKDVQVAYKSIDTIDLKVWTNSNNVLQLTPEQRQLSFSYKSIDINHPNQIEYRSKLNNNKWSPWSKEDKQNFAGLAYGRHQFSVQSRNYRWEVSDPIKFNYFIDSPIYKKPWFYWMIVSVIIAVLMGLGWLYIRRIRLKNKADKEQLLLQNHLLTLEHKALQLQMNPHFIFNVLNGVKAMAVSKPEKMNMTINSFAILLRETLNNSRKDYITLDQEIKTLYHYITLEQLMATKSFTFDIINTCELDAEEILMPPMLIQPFVENAIRHGILKGNKEGKLLIEFHTSEQYLHCKVIDNGMGIYKSQASKEKTDHQSMALTVTKERLTSISGKKALEITEIKNDNGIIDGTSITFKIPLLTDY